MPGGRAGNTSTKRVFSNLAGYRRKTDDGVAYFVTPTAWNEEITRGYNSHSLAKAMADRGLLLPENQRSRVKNQRIPGEGLRRVYHISPKLLEGEQTEDVWEEKCR